LSESLQVQVFREIVENDAGPISTVRVEIWKLHRFVEKSSTPNFFSANSKSETQSSLYRSAMTLLFSRGDGSRWQTRNGCFAAAAICIDVL